MRNIFLIIFVGITSFCFAQQNEIIVKAKIVDENNTIVPFADIAFRRLQLGFSSDKEGSFTVKMLSSDSLILLKKGYEVHGIDISRYQSNVRWDLVASQGISFAFQE